VRCTRALAWTPRAARARSGAVTCSMVAWWGLAGGKPASTGGVPGGTGKEERRWGPPRRSGDGKWPAWWRSGGKAAPAGWRRPRGGPAASGVGAGVRERGPGRDGDSAAARTRVTDKRGQAFAGPCGQRRGAGMSASERVDAALTSGAGSTVRPIQFSNRINFISNGFKFAPNFD
jgi:hypothetical protein